MILHSWNNIEIGEHEEVDSLLSIQLLVLEASVHPVVKNLECLDGAIRDFVRRRTSLLGCPVQSTIKELRVEAEKAPVDSELLFALKPFGDPNSDDIVVSRSGNDPLVW